MNLDTSDAPVIRNRAEDYFQSSLTERAVAADRRMAWLLAAEWLGMIGTALAVSPRTWNADQSALHPHLWAAILAGPAFILPAIAIALLNPGRALTRHVVAAAQILVSILLIDCTGGRIETHFHIFGSLAILASYLDWRVLLTASLLTAADHFFRGIWWPQSVYGVIAVSPWRWVEHLWWVSFEDFFLVLAAKTSLRDMRMVATSKARLYNGATHDVLTGLANRRRLGESFDMWLASAQSRKKAALLFIDLDRFKQANDTLGHTVGDKLLTLVAARFAETVGSAGTLARIGGDEFVVFLDKVSGVSGIDDAQELGLRLIRSLASPFRIDKHELLLSSSIGISLYPDHGTTLAALQERADRAMYVAKSQGRNRCVAFSSEVAWHEGFVQDIARDLSGALSRGEFQLYFQPQVRKGGQLAGFEALLRWKHPVHGTVKPDAFIPLAEQSGLIVSLGDWALAEACRSCRTWQEPGEPRVGVAVNVSALQFDQPDYPERVFGALAKTGLDPSLLTLELTEGILVRDLKRARGHLTRLRDAGIQVALDDFGTGYSSLSYLTELPVDLIKLDHTFVGRELRGSSPIIEFVVSLAHRLGLQVVAEGVETVDQWEGLVGLTCDQFQGYYFSKPIPASGVREMLRNRAGEGAEVLERAS